MVTHVPCSGDTVTDVTTFGAVHFEERHARRDRFTTALPFTGINQGGQAARPRENRLLSHPLERLESDRGSTPSMPQHCTARRRFD